MLRSERPMDLRDRDVRRTGDARHQRDIDVKETAEWWRRGE